MLSTRRVKYRKTQKGRMKGNTKRGAELAFGTFGIKSLDESFVTARQLEAARVAATRYMKRAGQSWIKVFPDKPMTRKPAEARMAKGKASPVLWAAKVQPVSILFERGGIPLVVAQEALRSAAQKL